MCDRCEVVTVPRHQLQHHKNESCFAFITCEKCGAQYRKNETHGPDECIIHLASMVKQLNETKVDRDTFQKYLWKKVDKKQYDEEVQLILNDTEKAKTTIN